MNAVPASAPVVEAAPVDVTEDAQAAAGSPAVHDTSIGANPGDIQGFDKVLAYFLLCHKD